jgi:hypothetical protein
MDSSGSIGDKDFIKEQTFVKTLMASLQIGQNETRVGIINYNTNAEVLVDFSKPQTLKSLTDIIDKIKYKGGNTNTAEALLFANERILNETKGMRPAKDGIPKVVVVITDGESNVNQKDTIPQANKLKDRGFSIISVGVGQGINLQELIAIASTPDDQYFVSDFDQIITLINGLSTATCQQPAVIESEQEIVSVVEQNAYKYFKFSLEKADENASSLASSSNKTYLDRFTIELKELNGSASLYFSFEENNPKAPSDLIQQNSQPEYDTNFIEIPENKSRKLDLKTAKSETKASNRAKKSQFYQVQRPTAGQNEYLYVSVKGMDKLNEFQIYVYNRTVNFETSIHKNLNIFIFVMGLLISRLFV